MNEFYYVDENGAIIKVARQPAKIIEGAFNYIDEAGHDYLVEDKVAFRLRGGFVDGEFTIYESEEQIKKVIKAFKLKGE